LGVELDERYQVEAYDQVRNDFEEGNRSCIVLPTGCGKSYIGLKLIEDNPEEEIIYISPSSVINAQVRKVIEETYGKDAKKIFPRLKFITYNALSRMDTEEFNKINPDKIILDELHRAGAEVWGERVNELLDRRPNAKVLGLTATPVRTDGRNMAEEICGGVSHELKLTEAVARGILPVPEYICARYLFNADMKRIEDKIELIEDAEEKAKYKDLVKQAKRSLEESNGIPEIFSEYIDEKDSKWIIFGRDTEHMDEIEELCVGENGWFKGVNEDIDVVKISYKNEREENVEALRFFRSEKNGKLRIAIARDMLNEGFHDKELSGVIMARPTESEILFRQQLGRALSRDAKHTPKIFDLVNNIRYFEEFRREVTEIIRQGIERGEGSRYSEDVLKGFKVFAETIDFMDKFAQIEANLDEYMQGETVVQKTLRVCQILNENGVDIKNLQLSRKINGKPTFTLLKDIVSKEILEENQLSGEFPIGYRVGEIRRAYKGKNTYAITEEEKRIAELIPGLIYEKGETVVQEALKVCQILYENGVDLKKLQLNKTIDGKNSKTLLRDIISEEILEANQLNGEFPIGQRIAVIRLAYKGTGNYKITEEDKRLAELIPGLIYEKGETVVQEALRICQILSENGIDFNNLQLSKTIKCDTKDKVLRDIISEEILEKYQLDGEFPIGRRIKAIRNACKGTVAYKITEEEKVLAKLIPGLIISETAIQETLRICQILNENGVDLKNITLSQTIDGKRGTTLLRDVIPEEILEKNQLDGEFPIGQKIRKIKNAYKGQGGYTITEEEKELAEIIPGLIFKETPIQEMLRICQMLNRIGIDFNNIQVCKTIDGKKGQTVLRDVIPEEILEKNQLSGEFPIGQSISRIRQACKDTSDYAITEDEKRLAKSIPGLICEKKESIIQKTLRICKVLIENGIDLKSLQLSQSINGKQCPILLKDIIPEEILEKNQLSGEFPIGQSISNTRKAYKGTGDYKITEEDRELAESIPGLISLELIKKEAQKQELLEQEKRARELRDQAREELEKKGNTKDV